MPRFEDFLMLNSFIYDSQPPATITVNGPGGAQEWVRLLQSNEPSDPGYYGAAYLNAQTNEIVLVNRGTNDLADLVADMQMALDKVPDQLVNAQLFYNDVQAAAVVRGATLSVTGHSLGGSLTQLLVASHAGESFNGVPIFGQTFNAFGARGLLNNLGLADADYRVTNWVTPTDVVGNLAEHIGTKQSLASLPFSFVYPAGPPGVLAFLYDSHKIAQVRDTFIADNGHPLLAETREFLIQTYVTDFAFPVTIDGQVIVGGNNRINVGNELTGSAQNDLLFGGLPDDRLNGGDGLDVIYAGPGNDTIWGDVGADILLGEDGNDTYIVDDPGDRVIEAAFGGNDTVASTVSYTLSRNVEQLILEGTGAIDGVGNELNNILIGNNAANVLDGEFGQDAMAGGGGNDTYVVDNPGDTVAEASGEGTDTVLSPFTYTLSPNVENLTLTGTDDLNGTGNDLNNDITGNSGTNRLEGKGGTDHLIGGLGNDILSGGVGNNDLLEGGAGFDTYIYNAGDGIDQIEDSDATGKIVFNGGLLQGGISTDGGATYVSLDGAETYVLSGGHLIVNGVLTVNADFQSGQFGIGLTDLSSYPTNTGVPVGPFQHIYLGTAGGDLMGNGVLAGNNGAYYGLGGNDHIIADVIGDNLQDGGADDDILQGRSGGNEYLDGGAGNDYVFAYVSFDLEHPIFYNGIFDGHDILLGGIGDDVLVVTGALPVGVAPDPDYLDGGAGTDYLRSEVGADRLLGGDGDDTLRGDNLPDGWPSISIIDNVILHVSGQADFSATGGADFLEGGSGNDLLVGDGGDDILSGGDGDDRLFGDDEAGYLVVPGDDMLDGGAGDDLLAGGDGEDSLSGGAGIDQLFGDKGVDVLDGGEEADTLHGGDGADELFGGAGNDQLFGDGLNNLSSLSSAGGADFLDGSAGNDHLEGGIGDDTLFGGTENDVLFGEEGADSLFGDEGADELQGGVGNDLLSGDAGDDRLFGQGDNDTLYGGEGNDQLAGNDGNDTLVGGIGTDILEGGKAADVLVGGAGHDAYNFSLGDGQDTITDRALAGEGNVIQFFSGITLESLTFIQDQTQQTLTIQVGGGDVIRLLGFDPNALNYVVDRLSFADGTEVALADQLPLPEGLVEGTGDNNVIRTGSTDDTIFAGAGNDVVTAGAGNDVLIGGAGADTLQGGVGQDTYVFASGDGMDIVLDTAGEGNRLLFGPGISTGSVTLGLGGGESVPVSVRTGVAGDAIQIISNLEGGESPSIDALEFADGTMLSIEELFERGIEITGTAGPDTLTGTNLIDRTSGGGGNDFIFAGLGADILRGEEGSDQLFGGDGNDQLDGGADNDVLNGESGQNTYVFGRGYGQDILLDFPVEQSGPNRIQLTSGVSPEDIRLQARQSDNSINVVLSINGTEDELTLLGAADPSLLPISQILFADGSSWNLAEILNRIEGVPITTSPTGSALEGTAFRDVLAGAQGNDDLDGLGGADRMVGGEGDDHYWVENPGDTVVELDGEGTDTVLSQIEYTLPEHVENLYLRSTNLPITDPVRGEGNANDNVLLGNFVNNVLIGGGGNDTIWGGFSIGSDYGPGDDDLYGGSGNDTYFVEGDFNGFDLVHDVALPGEGNRLQFGNSVRPEDVVFVQEGSTLRITNGGGANGASLVDFDPSGINGSMVTEVIAFSGGLEDVTGGYETRLLDLMNPTVGTDNADMITGTANAEIITALGGDDVIAGGAGNDVLLGGTGNDTYVFSQGDGLDLIDDQPGAGDTNVVQFGAGITQEMLRVLYSGTSSIGGLTVRIGTLGDGLHFLGVSADDPNVPHAIDRFQFTDGTQLTFSQLFEREILVQGTGRSDGEMFGTSGDDLMQGLSGSETLASQDGNDMLVGGPGNDVLDGGNGSDTYVFNLGDGFDEIRDDYSSSDTNRLRFGPGITVGDLALFDAGDGFTVNRIVIGTSGDEILLPNFIDAIPALTTAEFADRVTLNLINLNAANQRTDNQTITGGDGDTVLIGGTGNDTIIAGSGSTTLLGGAGSDTLIGGSGPNMFLGGPGNDFLVGGSGGNTFFFMVGNGLDAIQIPNYLTSIETNTVQFGGAYDTYHPTSGVGSLVIRYGTAGDELHILDFDPDDVFAPPAIHTFQFTDRTLTYGELIALGFDIDGTTGNDVLSGTNTTDRIDGLDGNDTIESGQGIDILRGGRGSDLLRGGAGDDTYLFNIGDEIDTIDDTVLPGKGNRIQFGAGITQGDLSFTRDAAPRTLTIQVGASGADKLVLANFDPTGVNGSLVVDTLTFAGGTTTNLADLFINHAPTVANPLADQSASTGTAFTFTVPADTFTDVDAGDVLTLSATLADGSALPAWLTFDSATRTFSGTPVDGDAGVVNLKVTATDTGTLSVADLFEATVTIQNQVLTGTAGNDVLTGGAGHDQLFGLAGNDTLNGAAGNDLLDGGTGTDTMAGGTENDTYVVNATGDIVTEQANEGTDTVQSALLTYTLGANVENLTLTVTGPSAGIGNGLANTLIGNSGANLLDGKAEADTMAGGAGDDLYIVDHVGDTVVELPGEGALDSVTSSVGCTLSTNVENLVLTGSAAINGTGNDADNVLTGNSAANVLTGLGGNDTYVIGAGDTVVEAAGRGTDTVISTVSHSLAANVENLTLVGFSAISGTGNALDNVLNGLLNLGTNVLTGGADNDTYIIGAGDTIVEAANGGTDSVQSMLTHTLGTNVENLTLTGIAAINGTGNALNNTLTGNRSNNTLSGAGGNDSLRGDFGNDTKNGGSGNDTFLFGRGDGQDLVQDNSGTADKILYDAGINPLDLVISRQANDLRLTIYSSSDRITVQNWYVGTTNRTETIQAGNGQTLLSTQVDQLLQAMASFSQQTGLTWDQAIDQQPAQVQAVLAASWQ